MNRKRPLVQCEECGAQVRWLAAHKKSAKHKNGGVRKGRVGAKIARTAGSSGSGRQRFDDEETEAPAQEGTREVGEVNTRVEEEVEDNGLDECVDDELDVADEYDGVMWQASSIGTLDETTEVDEMNQELARLRRTAGLTDAQMKKFIEWARTFEPRRDTLVKSLHELEKVEAASVAPTPLYSLPVIDKWGNHKTLDYRNLLDMLVLHLDENGAMEVMSWHYQESDDLEHECNSDDLQMFGKVHLGDSHPKMKLGVCCQVQQNVAGSPPVVVEVLKIFTFKPSGSLVWIKVLTLRPSSTICGVVKCDYGDRGFFPLSPHQVGMWRVEKLLSFRKEPTARVAYLNPDLTIQV